MTWGVPRQSTERKDGFVRWSSSSVGPHARVTAIDIDLLEFMHRITQTTVSIDQKEFNSQELI